MRTHGSPHARLLRRRRTSALAAVLTTFLVLLGLGTAPAAQAAGVAPGHQLTTLFAGGNGQSGNTFDLTVGAGSDIDISGFDLNVSYAGGPVSVYTRPGTAVGHENTPDGWTLRGSATPTTVNPSNSPTHIDLPIHLDSGDHGVLVAFNAGGGLNYTNGSATYSDANLTLTSGTGVGAPVLSGGAVYSPRIWNGTIYYDLSGPRTTITGGPEGRTSDPDPSFTFTGASEAEIASFECDLAPAEPGGSAGYETCESGIGYTGLPDAEYTFSVRAVDLDGDTGPSATREFTVDTTAPVFEVSPSTKDFGSQVADTTSAAEAFTVTNTGTADLDITTAALTGTDAGQYAVGTDGCTGVVLAPTDTCTVDVAFTPTSTGPKSAALEFDDNATGSPHQIPLTGTGIDRPEITQIDPPTGPMAGSTTVVITGTGFNDATGVRFGSAGPASGFTVDSDTQITAESPASTSAGRRHIRVRVPGGISRAVAEDVFTYVGVPPTVSGVAPNSGPIAGGNSVVITGTGFDGATSVVFGSAGPASDFTVDSDTQITAVAPNSPRAGTRNILVRTPQGRSAVVAADRYTYVGTTATITEVTPDSGPVAGGNSVVITGTGFLGTTVVLFGAAGAADSFTVDSDTQITAIAPPAAGEGVRHIRVRSPQGTSPAVHADRYTYTG